MVEWKAHRRSIRSYKCNSHHKQYDTDYKKHRFELVDQRNNQPKIFI